MRFKLDENLPTEIVADLRLAGHDADSVHEEGLSANPIPSCCGKLDRKAGFS